MLPVLPKRLADALDQRGPRQILLIALALVLATGAVDLVTGAEISVSVFYLAPVAIAAWHAGSTVGIVVSIASAFAWFFADRFAGGSYSHFAIPYWNAAVRLGF